MNCEICKRHSKFPECHECADMIDLLVRVRAEFGKPVTRAFAKKIMQDIMRDLEFHLKAQDN